MLLGSSRLTRACMPDVSYLCVMSRSQTLNDDVDSFVWNKNRWIFRVCKVARMATIFHLFLLFHCKRVVPVFSHFYFGRPEGTDRSGSYSCWFTLSAVSCSASMSITWADGVLVISIHIFQHNYQFIRVKNVTPMNNNLIYKQCNTANHECKLESVNLVNWNFLESLSIWHGLKHMPGFQFTIIKQWMSHSQI